MEPASVQNNGTAQGTVLHHFPSFVEVEERYPQIREEADRFFKRVYFANVKKTAGGAAADDRVIMQYAKDTAPLLVEQLRILQPNTVLCCGQAVFEAVRQSLIAAHQDFEAKRSPGGLEYLWWGAQRTSIIRYHHPNAFYPREMSYTFLMEEMRKMM
ncbi:hypothetical protein ACFFK0_06800 [Paenibacillus chartarius]|uniref:Uracil-DNA glycosylase-like domain-containing protein n=1 Tax=Paenibacillus chartarius TaxID=747481 RepID=A0ABV6DHR4_9BACL